MPGPGAGRRDVDPIETVGLDGQVVGGGVGGPLADRRFGDGGQDLVGGVQDVPPAGGEGQRVVALKSLGSVAPPSCSAARSAASSTPTVGSLIVAEDRGQGGGQADPAEEQGHVREVVRDAAEPLEGGA